jgi:S-DNA-T family DNA segregation ATPase FtsK/SpoIIIE
MPKKKAVKKPVGKSKSAAKHAVPGGFWQQVMAFMALVFALVLILAIIGAGGGAPSEIFKAFRALTGLVAFVIPFIIIYLALKKMFAESNMLPVSVHFGFVSFVAGASAMVSTIMSEDVKVENAGGEIGRTLSQTALNFLHPLAAFFIFLSLTIVSLMFIFKIQPKKLIEMIAALFRPRENTKVRQREDGEQEPNGLGFEKPTKIKLNRGVEVEDGSGNTLGEIEVKDGAENSNNASFRERFNSIKGGLVEKPEGSDEGEKSALTAVDDESWEFPSTEILDNKTYKADAGDIDKNARIIKETLADFKINVEMEEANVGPRVTQYTLKPAAGVKLNKITSLDTNLALNLSSNSIRLEAPIPGKGAVGVEVPNKKSAMVTMRSILESREWKNEKEPLAFAIGKDIAGHAIIGELSSMPHLLVAGQTGSGKSVMINNLIASLLFRYSPSEVKLILVDPKQVELAPYNGIAHLLTPVIIEPEKTLSALKWSVNEMERRYSLLAENGHRNIKGYNSDKKIEEHMPYIVIVIDELADLMMVAARDVEGLIVRIAQKARAVGIHLVLATQRPSVDVITGLIKANIPARIAFTVASQIDSRTIIDQAGAEKLLGKGDMLITTAQNPKPKRVQAAWIDDPEIVKVINQIKTQRAPDYNDEVVAQPVQLNGKGGVVFDAGGDGDSDDEMYNEAVAAVMAAGKASASLLQRRLRVGYARAARLMEEMEDNGVIGPADGSRPRDVLVSGNPNAGSGSNLSAGPSSGGAVGNSEEDFF